MEMEAEALTKMISTVGFPIVCVLSGGYGIWLILRWAATAIIEPTRDRAFKFLDKLEANVDSMRENLDTQTTTLVDINDGQSAMQKTLQKIADQGCGENERNGRNPPPGPGCDKIREKP